VEACHVQQTVLAAYRGFVLGACVHVVITGEIRPEQVPQVAEYGLATALPPSGGALRCRPESGQASLGAADLPPLRPLTA
jgi:hypothetical protein